MQRNDVYKHLRAGDFIMITEFHGRHTMGMFLELCAGPEEFNSNDALILVNGKIERWGVVIRDLRIIERLDECL